MENKEAIHHLIKLYDNLEKFFSQMGYHLKEEYTNARALAISALEKQEQDSNKCCEICKYKNLAVSEFPCDECYFASDFEDYYEPYTEEES